MEEAKFGLGAPEGVQGEARDPPHSLSLSSPLMGASSWSLKPRVWIDLVLSEVRKLVSLHLSSRWGS